MAGNLNAIGIIGVVLLTIFIMFKFAKKPAKSSRVSLSILITCLVVLLTFSISIHSCIAGQPFLQWLIPSICLGCILIFVEPKAIRRGVAFIVIVAGFALSIQFVTLVHTDTYNGNPDGANRFILRTAGKNLESVKEILSGVAETNNIVYPVSWLSDLELRQFIPEDKQYLLHNKYVETYNLWHTFFTGLYGKKVSELDTWYPGGTLKDAVDKIEFREKL